MSVRGITDRRLQPVVSLRVRDPGGGDVVTVSAIVDTGFTGVLTLPAAVITRARLAKLTTRRVELGNGAIRSLDVYRLEVDWNGTWRETMCYAAGTESLLGLRLLAGHRLTVDVVPGGAVMVTPVP